MIATADTGTHPDGVVLAAWELLATRGVTVEFVEEPPARPGELPAEDLVTIATFRSYIQAQFAQTRLQASGIRTFLFDDNTIRINWFWSTALGGVKLRVPRGDVTESVEILRSVA